MATPATRPPDFPTFGLVLRLRKWRQKARALDKVRAWRKEGRDDRRIRRSLGLSTQQLRDLIDLGPAPDTERGVHRIVVHYGGTRTPGWRVRSKIVAQEPHYDA